MDEFCPGVCARISPDRDVIQVGGLQARVVRVAPLAHLWLCGCELTTPLTEIQLRDWLAGYTPDRATKTGW